MLEIKQLSFGYGQEALFRDTTLTLDPGNVYGLLGLNGAGKSTLLRLMTGLLFPTSGTITARGYEPAKRQPGFLSSVFTLPEELNAPGVTDREYISVHAPFYPGFDHDCMERFLGEFDIPRRCKLTEFSYGQKKKFLLSFGLASNAALLMLDEPTNGLDIPSKGLFRRLVAEALSEKRIFVVSTHQVQDVESLIDHIVILHEGKVVFNHTVAQVTDNLRMCHGANRPQEGLDGLLYSEPTVGGFATVWRDSQAGDGRLDLELLFKAVISSPGTYATLLETGK